MLGASFGATQAQTPNRAGLVVQFGDGSVVQACVEFTEPSITGWDLLNRSGLAVYHEDYGGSHNAICKLETGSTGNGCEYPLEDCWCKCVTSDNCNYWAYHHLINGDWQYAFEGASSWIIENGMVDGWGWGLGEINNSGVAPPVIPFDEICIPDIPTPTPITTPTMTPTTTPGPWPTETPIPPPTSTPPPPTEIPEPATLLLVGSGIAGLAAYAHRRISAK